MIISYLKRNVFPSLASDNQPDCFVAYEKCPRNSFTGKKSTLVAFKDFQHFSIRKFCLSIFFSVDPASFFVHITEIIKMCSKKKVRWIDAGWVVAFMKHQHAYWNRILKIFKCESMGISFIRPKNAITLRQTCADPEPAIISFFNMSPKSFNCWDAFIDSHLIDSTQFPCGEVKQ